LEAKDLFPELHEAVKRAHQQYGLTASGHDFNHDDRVANYAGIIAPDDLIRRKAVAAGYCHSIDHMLEKHLELSPDPDKEIEVEKLVRELLENTDFTAEERDDVVHVVLRHEGVNKETDTPLQITLCDADRLANMDADVIIRGGQFHPDLLAVDLVHFENDPGATYRDPRSVLWDVNNCATWANETGPYILRLPKARELGRSRAVFLKLYIFMVRTQHAEAHKGF